MFRTCKTPRQTSRLEQPRSASITFLSGHGSKSRAGRAFTEVVLIVLVPCFCLMMWAIFDSELKKSLLAGPTKDHLLTVNPVYDAVTMENDSVLTVQGQGQLRIWDLKKSVMLGEMQSHLSEVRCADYTSEQRLLAVGSAMGKLEIWDLEHPETPVVTDDPLLHEVSDCLFVPGGKILLTSGEDGKIVLWNPRTLEQVDTLISSETQESVRSLGISRDGKQVIAGTHSGLVQIWDLESRKMLRTHRVAAQYQRPEAAVETVGFLADGINFISATRNDGVAIWSSETGACIRHFSGSVKGLRSGILSSDETRFVAGSEDGVVVTWDVATGDRIGVPVVQGAIVRSLACSTDGQTLLSGDWNGRVQFQHGSDRPILGEIIRR